MANSNRPFGFDVYKSDGKENKTNPYVKTTGAAMYPGDAVKLVAAGTVSVAAAGDQIIGIAAEYRASADAVINVYDDPDQDFWVQVSADFQAADVGQCANIVATTGDTTLKTSKNAIDSSTYGTELAKQFKLLGLVPRGENAVGSYAIIKVKPNNHVFKTGISGI